MDSAREALADFLSWDHEILLVSRASLGLQAVLAVRKPAGHNLVALSPLVCQDVVSAILNAGCAPYFVDVDPTSGEVPPGAWKDAREVGCTTAIAVHLYGRSTDVEAANGAFLDSDDLVIDDAAQALGSGQEAGLAGTLAGVGLLSFGRSKHIGTGGAAVLFRSSHLAEEVCQYLSARPHQKTDEARAIQQRFREKFDFARRGLLSPTPSVDGFAGLLDAYGPSLEIAVPERAFSELPAQLREFRDQIDLRRSNTAAWKCELDGTGFSELAFGCGDVPWRYACRLEGISWQQQFTIARDIRKLGVDVSNWYLPAHWYLSQDHSLAGAESFSREVFQFWVDPGMNRSKIEKASKGIRLVLEHSATLPK